MSSDYYKWALMWYVKWQLIMFRVAANVSLCSSFFLLPWGGCASIGVGLLVAKRHVECKHLSVPVTHTRPNTRGSNPFKWKWITGQTATLWHLWVLLVFTFLTVLHNKSRKMQECESDFFFKAMKEKITRNIANANDAGKAHVPCPVWKT